VGLGILVGVGVLLAAAAVSAIEAHRVRTETTQLTAALARLGHVRRALDAVRAQSDSTRVAAMSTADLFAHRGRR
jgi:GAF domain-containing protein